MQALCWDGAARAALPRPLPRLSQRARAARAGAAQAGALPDDLSIEDEERDPAVAAAIGSLPPRRRLVVLLRYFAGFSYAEIAEALGISEGTVAATLSQAQAALRDAPTTTEVTR